MSKCQNVDDSTISQLEKIVTERQQSIDALEELKFVIFNTKTYCTCTSTWCMSNPSVNIHVHVHCTVYRIARKFGGCNIWRIYKKMHLAVFKIGDS